MRISATGIWSRKARGFTLLELLVVLLLIGIILASVGLSGGDSRERRMKTEAERLAALLNLARQEAVLTAREYAAEFQARGYRFYQWRQEGWQLVREEVFRPRQLPPEFQLELLLPGDLPGKEALPRAAGAEPLPRIYLLSSGETTPFELYVRADAGRLSYSITGSAQGKIDLVYQALEGR